MQPITTSVADTCRALSLGRTTIYKLIDEGKLLTVKIGRRTLIKTDSIHRLINPDA